MMDVVTNFAREGVLSELLYADGFVLMSETINFKSRHLNVNLV